MGSVDQAVIREMAAALRHTCDRILNEGASLTLPAAALRVLHAHFSALFPAVVRGEFCPAAGSPLVATEALHDLQFLRDLAQLTAGLRVTAGSQGLAAAASTAPEEGPVPLGDFSRLERLQLVSVPVAWVQGLQARRPYLRALSCDASVTSLAELLADCGGDQSSPFLWEELAELRVTRCRLTEVERDALRLAPHITQLDLSHNRLESGDSLDRLAGLQRLNMTANLLTAVPVLSMPAHLALRRLYLRGNKLENIDGVEEMTALEHLDISYNLLLSHAVLRPLLQLSRLQALQLSGNPLTCLSDHRRRTAEHLHHNCHAGQLLLDGRRLLASEVPRFRDPPAARTALRPSPSSGSGGEPSPPRPRLGRPPSQPGRRGRTGVSTPCTGPAEKGSGGSTPRLHHRRSKRRSRVNMADISDMDSTASLTGVMSSSLNGVTEASDTDSTQHKEVPTHLVTRERIESLRQQMGADWLHSGGGARVQELLGLPAHPPPTFSVGSAPIESPASRAVNGTRGTGPARRTPPGADQPLPPPADPSPAAAAPAEPSLYPSREPDLSWEHRTSDEDEEEEEDVACLVVARRLMRPGLEEDVMLTVTATAVKEKELDAGRTVAEWDLRCVEACHVTKMEPLTVQLNFDTVRKEKRERNYTMEQTEWEELSAALLPVVEARLASELAANALQCMKCAAEFSDALAKTTAAHDDVKAGRTKHVQSCPNCGSNMIIRAEKVSHPNEDVARSPGMLANVMSKKPPLKKRLSSKKIVASTPRHMMEQKTEASFLGASPVTDEASADTEHVSETSSTTTKAGTHTDSSVSVVTPEPELAAVRGHVGRLTDHPTPERAESHVRSDSDVEVISNPSESSIDVIMDSTARSETHPAADGRETAAPAGQESVTGPSWPPMEESSSSGSMTTSVCTVRDNRGAATAAAPPPPPPAATSASDAADLSCTLTPESVTSDVLDSSAISPLDSSAISPHDSSAISPHDSSAISPSLNDSADGVDGRPDSESVLDSWRRGGESESESESDTVEEAGSGRLRFWHGDLTRLDHRLQLHLDMSVLQADERVVCVAKCTCAIEPQYREQECVLAVSSATLYILEITGDDSDQLERWLRPRLTRPLTEVSSVGPLLHCHGLGLQLTGREPSLNTQVLIITRDAARGRLLLRHLTESCSQATETDRWLASQRLQVEHMLSGDAGANLNLQQLLFVQLLSGDSANSESAAVPVMLCMTPSDLLLMECDLRWLVPGHGDVKIPMRDREKVANIVGLELLRCAAAGRPGLRLLFQDAGSGAEHSWRLAAASRATVADLVTALQQPWAGAAAAGAERPQAACDLYRTTEGDVLRLGRLPAPLTGSWLRVTAERRPAD